MAQEQQINLKLKGLYLASNDFSGVPDGALDEANNIVIDEDNLGEPRRGFQQLVGTLPLVSDRINRFTNYQGFKVVQYRDSKVASYNAGVYTTYSGTFNHPDPSLAKLRFVEAQQNLFWSTSAGIIKLDAIGNVPAAAGIPKGLDLQLALTGSSGFFGTNEAATVTGNTTNLSANLTFLSSIDGIIVGQIVFGTGIPAGTTVSSITPSVTTLITTGDITAGSASMTNVPTSSGLTVGNFISAAGVPEGTRITVIAGAGPYTITMSNAAIATTTAVPVTFSSDPVVTMSANATATATVSITFSEGSQVGYRLIFGKRDANNNVPVGSPSQFAVISNTTGATTNVQLTSSIPSGITTSHFYQAYRTNQTASTAISPSDDEQLVHEATVTSTDLTNGYVQFTDSTPDSLRGANLYTSTNEEGISQANDPPPYAKDFCLFRNFGIYVNVKSKQRKKLTILAVGAPSGVQIGNTLTIGGITFTAAAAEVIATGTFQVFTTGTAAQNIADTANSLIRVINRYATNTVTYAYLLSGPNDLPGQMLLEERGTGGSSFAITASANGTAYSPALPTSGTTVSSSQDIYKNGVMIAKEGQFEAVPQINLIFAGTASAEILRIIPLREYALILKQDGIYRLTGTSLSSMQIQPFDVTVNLIAPDTAVSLSNEVWGLFDQGVCSISDTGTNVRSRPIENVTKMLVSLAPTAVKTVSFGIAYETDRKYILSLPSSSGDTSTNQQYIFHTFTNAWTRWTRTATAGTVDKVDDRIYFGNSDSNTASYERKDNTYTDYVDESFGVSITASSGKTITLNSVTGITVGDVLYQSSSAASIITSINLGAIQVTVADTLTWTVAAASILPAINSTIQWKPMVAGNPAYVRQYSEGNIVFKRARFNTGAVNMYSDVSQGFESTPLITGFTVATWGTFPWGNQPWGGVNRPRSARFLVPQNKQMCSQLSARLELRNGYSNWAVEGLTMSYNDVNQEVS